LAGSEEPLKIEGFDVCGLLGSGASSLVFAVADESGRDLALKLLARREDDSLLRSEFGRLSRLDHPNLIRVHDIGRTTTELSFAGRRFDANTLYIVMDRVSGRPADDYYRENKGEPDLLQTAWDLASAVEYMHSRGLLHHDIKPQNLLVRDSGKATLIDLGLATRAEASFGARGTLAFMAPEALVGGGDQRADLYGIGATLFALAAKTPPFAEVTGSALVEAIVEQPVRRLLGVGKGLSELIARLLSKDPLERPQTARALRAELARLRGDVNLVSSLASTPQLASPSFCGRSGPLSQLLALLEQNAPVVLVVGDPGSGKSRLIKEALRRQRILFAAGRAEPWRLVTDLREHCDLEGDDEARAWQVVERLGELGSTSRLLVHIDEGETDPFARLVAERLLEANGDISGISFVFELPRRARGFERLTDYSAVSQVVLGPLPKGALEQLFSSMTGLKPTSDDIDALLSATAGSPAIAVEFIRQWVRNGGRERLSDLGRSDVAGLDGLLARQRATLESPAKDALDVLAVLQRPATVSEISQRLDVPEEQIWTALLSLAGEGLIVVSEGRARFSAPAHYRSWQRAIPDDGYVRLARQCAPHEHDQARRIELSLAGLGERPLDGALLQALLAVANQLADRDELLRAIALSERAIERLPRGKSLDVERDRLLRTAAELHLRAARYERALDLCRRCAPPAPLLEAEILRRKGDYEPARQLLSESLSLLDGLERKRAKVLLGRLLLRIGQSKEALSLCDKEARLHLRGKEPLEAESAGVMEVAGLANYYLGDFATALEIFEAARARLFDEAALRARFTSMCGMVAFNRGRLVRAAALYKQALDAAKETKERHAEATYRGNLGSTRLELGEYREALSDLSATARDLARLGRTAEAATAACNLGGLLLALGDLEQASASADRADALLRTTGNRHIEGYVHLLRSEVAARKGELQRSLEAQSRAVEAFSDAGATRELQTASMVRVRLLLDSGQRIAAETLFAELQKDAGSDEQGYDGALVMLRARLLLARPTAPALELLDVVCEGLADHCAWLQRRGARPTLFRASGLLARLLQRYRPQVAGTFFQFALSCWEELMSKAPDGYRNTMQEDTDVRELQQAWQGFLQKRPAEAEAGRAAEQPEDAQLLRRLLVINRRLNSEHRLPNLLELIVDTVIDLTGAERGFVLLSRRGGPETAGAEGKAPRLVVETARNIDRRSLEGDGELALSRSIAEQAMQTLAPVVTIDAESDDRFAAARSVTALGLRSVLAVPLSVKGQIVGAVYVDHRLREAAFGRREIQLVEDFAQQAAIALENARLLAENESRRAEIETLNQRLAAEVEKQAAELSEVREELRSSRQALEVRYNYANIVGRTPRMLELFRLVDRITDTDLPVVVFGESGTGKELVARAIHVNGKRAEQRFVGENCGAIPETLLESVLFGAVKGAYTGAHRDRKGLFEVADGGTLFLDEVGEMSPGMQTKLLRVLQDGEFRPVGGERVIRVDVRVIAASNKDLRKLVEDGSFREDLFYRLNVVRIDIPALRDRREDIPMLVEHFLRKHGAEGRRISKAAMARLMGYGWPGNVRELENEVMRLVALAGDVIEPEDLSPQLSAGEPLALRDPDDLTLKPRVEHLERQLIKRALELTRQNQSRAAKLLGLSRYGLLKKLKRYFPERYGGQEKTRGGE
jgi:transcriptional regulator with GAF, ATPase, and Fis domain/tetratricopeptide (TPR) repeat protein